MPTKLEITRVMLNTAEDWAKLSKCSRLKVGAVIAKDNRIISTGYNGQPAGLDNTCEDEDGNTKLSTLHAEQNAILAVAKSSQSTEDSVMYTAFSPCEICAAMIIQAGIKEVVFTDFYRKPQGIIMLLKAGVKVTRLMESGNLATINQDAVRVLVQTLS